MSVHPMSEQRAHPAPRHGRWPRRRLLIRRPWAKATSRQIDVNTGVETGMYSDVGERRAA